MTNVKDSGENVVINNNLIHKCFTDPVRPVSYEKLWRVTAVQIVQESEGGSQCSDFLVLKSHKVA